MASKDQVTLDIVIETQKAVRELQDFQKNSAKSVGSMEKSFISLKTVAAAAVSIFAGREVINFFREGINAAVKQEQALAKLNSQLRLTGANVAGATESFIALADQLERTTKFEDDQILEAAALAKTFGITNEQAAELVNTAADLSVATGKDLTTAVNLLGKSYSGVLGPLDEVDHNLKGLTKTQLASGEAVRILGDRYKGVAQDEIKTFNGALNQAGKAFDNFREAFGSIIIENQTVIEALSLFGQVFFGLEDGVKNNQEALSKFVTVGVKAFVTGISLAIKISEEFLNALGLVTSGIVVAFSNLVKAAAKIEEFIGIDDTVQKFSESVDEFTTSTVGGFDAVVSSAQRTSEEFDELAVRVFEADQKTVKSAKLALKEKKEIRKLDVEDAEKAAREARKRIEEIAADPVRFILESNGVNSEELGKGVGAAFSQEAKEGIAAGAGILKGVLSGRKGAEEFFKAGAGAFADALIPGLGPVVSEITGLLMQGPERVKEFVREFIRAIPEIMDAIGESMPVVVEAFVDSMINEGGAIKIGISIARAMSGEYFIKAMGKQIATGFTEEFTAKAGALSQQIATNIVGGITKGFNETFGKGIKLANLDTVEDLIRALRNFSKGSDSINDFINSLRDFFKGPKWLADFIDALKNPGKFVGGGGGGVLGTGQGPDKGPVTGIKGSPFATGGLVPPGFPSDSFPARLTSGEFVANTEQTKKLDKFLDNQPGQTGGPIQIILQVGEQQLADVILNLNRQGFRTA